MNITKDELEVEFKTIMFCIKQLKRQYEEIGSDFEEELETLFNSKTSINKFTKEEKFNIKLLREKVEIYEKITEDMEKLLK